MHVIPGMNRLTLALGLMLVSTAAIAEVSPIRIPSVHGENFAGQTVSLPEAFHGKPGVLVIGFTQASRDAVTQWGTWLANDPAGRAALDYYELPVLASVPKLLRGFVAGRVKAAVADSEKSHFLPVLDHEAEWRALAHYTTPDDAYVLLIDGKGYVRWQTHGPPTDQTRAALSQGLATAIAR